VRRQANPCDLRHERLTSPRGADESQNGPRELHYAGSKNVARKNAEPEKTRMLDLAEGKIRDTDDNFHAGMSHIEESANIVSIRMAAPSLELLGIAFTMYQSR